MVGDIHLDGLEFFFHEAASPRKINGLIVEGL
jgi:hypothetical protein